MTEIDFEAFEDQLPFLIHDVEPGTVFVITHDGVPIAEFKMIARPPQLPPAPLGEGKELVQIPPSFFDPLPPDILAAFEGEAQ